MFHLITFIISIVGCLAAYFVSKHTYYNTEWLYLLSISLISVYLFYLLIVKLSSFIARKNPTILLLVFKTGFRATILLVAITLLTTGIIITYSIYMIEAIFIHRVHIVACIGIGLGCLILAFLMLTSLIAPKKVETAVFGKAIDKEEFPLLWKHIETLAEKVGALKPENIILGLNPEFFVTEANVNCLNGKRTGRTLYISLSLSRILKIEEIDSIIGHELGHFKGNDTTFTKKFYPEYRATVKAIDLLYDNKNTNLSIPCDKYFVLFL